jgi:hypothetical protein
MTVMKRTRVHYSFVKIISLVVLALFLAGVGVSCTSKVNDMRLSSLEKSIEKLEQNYSKYSPEKLKKEIEYCEKQFDELSEKKGELSQDQRRRLSNLKGQYHKLLIKICASDVSLDIIEYIKGLF